MPNGYKFMGEVKQKNLLSSVPQDKDFNPYDYIDQSNYKMNRRGQAQYSEDLASLLYMAQINQEERMNEYNSPSAQVQRMREAGLNPDLQGVENVPAQNVAGYNENPIAGLPTNLQQVSDVAGIIQSVISIAGGISNGIGTIFKQPFDLAKSAVDLFNAGPQFDMSSIVKGAYLPKRLKNQISKMYLSGGDWADANRNKFYIENLKTHGEKWATELNPRYVDARQFEDSEHEREYFTKVWKPFIDASEDLVLKQLEGEKSDIDFKMDKNKMWSSLRKPINEVFDNLDKIDADWAIVAKAAFASVLIKMLGM